MLHSHSQQSSYNVRLITCSCSIFHSALFPAGYVSNYVVNAWIHGLVYKRPASSCSIATPLLANFTGFALLVLAFFFLPVITQVL
ncbi:hypothetical protein V8C26DRAFT_389194, partial [Trichoderma gracile]